VVADHPVRGLRDILAARPARTGQRFQVAALLIFPMPIPPQIWLAMVRVARIELRAIVFDAERSRDRCAGPRLFQFVDVA
jgi:hypothetical protein